MYKYDLHVHTSEISPCGNVSAKDMVHLYKEAGVDGVVVANHFSSYGFQKFGEMTWEERVELFYNGYLMAKEEGEKIGLTVLFSAELTLNENWRDNLIFGITKEFLLAHPNIYEMNTKDLFEMLRKEDFVLVQAHPFRGDAGHQPPEYLDGVEIYNGNKRHNSHEAAAQCFAEKHNLIATAGSDFHEVEDLARAGIMTEEKINTMQDLKRILRERSFKPYKIY